MHHRQRRVGDQLRLELADLLMKEVRDPRLGFVTVTEVRMSRDLSFARVFVSVMGDDESEAASLEVLQKVNGYLRSRIGKKLHMRYVPQLAFQPDRTLKQSERLETLLESVRDDLAPPDGGLDVQS